MRIAARLFAILALMVVPTFAHADTYQFTMTGGTGFDPTSFDLPSSPTPFQYCSCSFLLKPVDVTYDGVPYVEGVLFAVNGFIVNGEATYATADGTVFTGPNSAPTFKLGTFSVTEIAPDSATGTLTITDLTTSTVPEPSTIALVGSGLGLAGAARRRFFAT